MPMPTAAAISGLSRSACAVWALAHCARAEYGRHQLGRKPAGNRVKLLRASADCHITIDPGLEDDMIAGLGGRLTRLHLSVRMDGNASEEINRRGNVDDAVADVRADFEQLREPWSKRGHAMGLGLGIESGYATLGLVGFKGRSDYTAIGGVVNIASRLCDRAADGQILITQRAYLDVETNVQAKSLGAFELKGVKTPLEVYNVLGLSELAA